MESNLTKIGEYTSEFNIILGVNYDELDIFYSNGLRSHMIKHGHGDCIPYIEDLPTIISSPDYIGINPNEAGKSIELVKSLDKDILVGIKLDEDEGHYYVSTMFRIQNNKITRRVYSGRLKPFSKT